MIPVFLPYISDAAIRSVHEVLISGKISEGRLVKTFEENFCKFTFAKYALALNSGTAALHLAILGAGVSDGDEVITSAQTFIATGQAVMMTGGKVIFADIQGDTGNIDPEDVERRVTERTKAILVVHYGGYPCDMDEICRIAERRNIIVIEDAAHAIGATYKGKAIGCISPFVCFSFQAIKQITTGDGGMLAISDNHTYSDLKKRRWFGLVRDSNQKNTEAREEYDVCSVGYKYHMNEIAAALGIEHLREYNKRLVRRQQIELIYRRELSNVSGLQLLSKTSDRTSACFFFTVLVEHRNDFIKTMNSRGVEAGIWHHRIDQYTVFGGLRHDLPNQNRFSMSQVILPLRDNLSDMEVQAVIQAVSKGW